MRVALISTPFVACPPANYGGTELIAYQLAEGLVRQGHEVVLYATGDSSTNATLKYRFEQAVWPPSALIECEHVAFALHDIQKQPQSFDIIHAHGAIALQLTRYVPSIPFVYTVHHHRETKFTDLYQRHPEAHYIFISERQRTLEKPLMRSAVIHHGLSPEVYRFSSAPGSYLAFLGRFAPYKGPLAAIAVAREAGIPLRMGGRLHHADLTADEKHFQLTLEQGLNLPGIEYLGSLDHARKVELLAGAKALLFPIRWEEPFGLVMIEAMLCGTPVIAFEAGSVPEVIEDGVTGFIVRDQQEMLARLKDLSQLDRVRVREEAVRRFSADRMVEDHIRLYRSILDERESSNELSTLKAS